MIEKLKKFKNLIKDLFFNTLGFGIYILTQQILLMPIMAKILPDEDFAKTVLYISIFAIITNVLGSELGIVKQVKKDEIREKSKTLEEQIQRTDFEISKLNSIEFEISL